MMRRPDHLINESALRDTQRRLRERIQSVWTWIEDFVVEEGTRR